MKVEEIKIMGHATPHAPSSHYCLDKLLFFLLFSAKEQHRESEICRFGNHTLLQKKHRAAFYGRRRKARYG